MDVVKMVFAIKTSNVNAREDLKVFFNIKIKAKIVLNLILMKMLFW
jgi:hypothetical protein